MDFSPYDVAGERAVVPGVEKTGRGVEPARDKGQRVDSEKGNGEEDKRVKGKIG